MIHLIEQHSTMVSLALYFLFSAVVGGMPQPDDKSGRAYLWAYHSLHILAGNVASLVSTKSKTTIVS